jgi:zinc transport system permease protein
MTELIELFSFPFMQRALIGGALLGVLLALIGVFVILRRMAFFGDGIAHASLAGIAIGILASLNPFFIAILFGVVFAVLIFYLERKTTLAPDTLIGVIFTASLSLGVILMSFKSGYQPELFSFLFGNILTIKSADLVIMSIFAILVLLFAWRYYKQLTFVALDREGAEVAGINTDALDLQFYIMLSISVILGVKILGVILVSALLIIPAAIGKLVSKSFKELSIISIAVSEVIILGGILTSAALNLPTGAVIVLFGTALFLATIAFRNKR